MHAERSQRINIVRPLAQVVGVIAILTILNEIAAATHTVEAEAQARNAFAVNGLVPSFTSPSSLFLQGLWQ
jgi:hypothetical protein